jgi:hypothetical protein
MAMSLEEFAEKTGRYASADWYVGQRVASCPDEPGDGAVWAIVFESGAAFYNYDPLITNPRMKIVGAGLTQVVMTSKRTELRFGLETVTINPLQWSMRDDVHTIGEMVFPQRSTLNM